VRSLELALGLSLAALPAVAETHGSISESFTAGSGPYIGNSLSAGLSSGIVDVDLGYDFGSDQDLVLYHSLWGSVGVWPVKSVRLLIEGSFGPRSSSTTLDRGFFSLGSGGVAGSVLWHPGRSGEVRPYLELGGSYDRYDISEAGADSLQDVVDANFSQETIRATAGLDVSDTALRFGASKFFYSADAGALNLPPGVGAGPAGVGAVSGALPTRAEDWNVRGSVRQQFGEHRDWDAQIGLSYGSYVDGDGSIVALSLRVGHDLSRTLRAHMGLTGQVESFGQNAGADTQPGVFANAGISVKF
jgi:hypothetical protein